MNSRLVLTSLAILALAATGAWAGSETTNSVSRTETVKPGQRLDVRLDTGAELVITGWDKNEVNVKAGWKDSECPGAAITVDRTDSGIRVDSHYADDGVRNHSCSLEIQVYVPRKFDLRLKSAGGGLELSKVNGTFDGYTRGGSLELDQVQGTVTLTTGGGSINVKDSDLDGHLSTGGGSVNFTNVRGPVRGTSGSMQHPVYGKGKTI